MEINKNIAVSDNGFLFNPATGESYNLNETGTELLKLIKENTPFEEISKIFLNKYETTAISFEKDFQDFVEILEQYKLTEKGNR
ncbi:MAG: PqqD family protein [Bacteroidales bacterium]|nr:PqqD family protein [Bacteroidales bacterium]